MTVTKIFAAAFAVVLTSVLPRSVLAQPAETPADKLFREGYDALQAGRYDEACPKLEQSLTLDPTATGAKYRLAECYEATKKLATAWRLFVEVANESKAAGKREREEQARRHADELHDELPTLTIAISPEIAAIAGLEVERDGTSVPPHDWNQKLPLDPGEHVVVVAAPGKKSSRSVVNAEPSKASTVTPPPLEDDAGAPPPPPPPTPTPRPDGPSPVGPKPAPFVPAPEAPKPAPEATSNGKAQMIAGIVTGIVGLGGVALGIGFGVKAKSTWDDAESHCKDGDHSRCDPTGVALGDDAYTQAAVSTTGLVVGGALVVTGLAVWLTAPSSDEGEAALRIVPSVGKNGGFLLAEGSF